MSNDTIKTIFCSQCGTKNDINANFCTSCGSKLVKPKAPAVEVPAVQTPIEEKPIEEPVAVPVAESETASPVVEEPVIEEAPAEEPIVVPVVEAEPEAPVVEEPVEEEVPPKEPVVVPAVEPETAVPVVEEPVEEEVPAEEPVVVPALEPEPEPPDVEEPVAEEIPAEEPVAAPVALPVTEAPVTKKKGKEKPVKEKPKAEPAVAPEPRKEDKTVQHNSYYYYNSPENAVPSAPVQAEPKKKRRQNFFLKFLSFLLALILTASLAVALPITLLNLFLTDHNIEIIVDHAISTIELEKLEFSTENGTKSLSGVLLEITDEFEGWNHITEEQINDALLEDFVKQFVTDTLKQYGMSLKDGEQMLGWTPEQIYDFVEANKGTIEKLAREAGYEGKLPIEEKKDMMIANIEQKIGKDGISVNTLLGNTSEADKIADYLNKASILFSDNTLYLAWGLVAFIVILLIFVNIGYFGSFLRACGFPAFIIGCIYFLAALAVNPVLSLINIPNAAIASAVNFTVGFIVAFLMDISLIVAAVGLGMILVSLIADAIMRKINKE